MEGREDPSDQISDRGLKSTLKICESESSALAPHSNNCHF